MKLKFDKKFVCNLKSMEKENKHLFILPVALLLCGMILSFVINILPLQDTPSHHQTAVWLSTCIAVLGGVLAANHQVQYIVSLLILGKVEVGEKKDDLIAIIALPILTVLTSIAISPSASTYLLREFSLPNYLPNLIGGFLMIFFVQAFIKFTILESLEKLRYSKQEQEKTL